MEPTQCCQFAIVVEPVGPMYNMYTYIYICMCIYIYIYIYVCIYIIFISTTGLCADIHLKRERRAGEVEDKSFPIKVVAKSDFTNYFDHCSASCKFANLRSSVPSTVIWARGKVHRLSRDLTKCPTVRFSPTKKQRNKFSLSAEMYNAHYSWGLSTFRECVAQLW